MAPVLAIAGMVAKRRPSRGGGFDPVGESLLPFSTGPSLANSQLWESGHGDGGQAQAALTCIDRPPGRTGDDGRYIELGVVNKLATQHNVD